MLKARLSEAQPLFKAKQGSMVAYQGDVNFACEGSGGMGKMLKTAMTSECMARMKVSGDGDVFLADRADDEFNTTFTETGTLAITVHGTPVVLDMDVPTFVDVAAAVHWSTSLKSGFRKTAKTRHLLGKDRARVGRRARQRGVRARRGARQPPPPR
ncbi:MAG: AIM24 family protein, partial [Candidatus Nanopelagicales bacterium]